MKNPELLDLFVNELEDMYSSEIQIYDALPQVIKLAHLPDLREAFTKHWKETEIQIRRIEEICEILGRMAVVAPCVSMEGMLYELKQLISDHPKSATLDAAIISAMQKVEHYEIASYNSLRSFAINLDLDTRIIALIDATLNEEIAADKKLNKLAEGTIFRTGIVKDAAEHVTASRVNSWR